MRLSSSKLAIKTQLSMQASLLGRQVLVSSASGPHLRTLRTVINLLVSGLSLHRARPWLSDRRTACWSGWAISAASLKACASLCTPSSLHSLAMQSRQPFYPPHSAHPTVAVTINQVRSNSRAHLACFTTVSAERKLGIRKCLDYLKRLSLDNLTWFSTCRGSGCFCTRFSVFCQCSSYAKSKRWVP